MNLCIELLQPYVSCLITIIVLENYWMQEFVIWEWCSYLDENGFVSIKHAFYNYFMQYFLTLLYEQYVSWICKLSFMYVSLCLFFYVLTSLSYITNYNANTGTYVFTIRGL